MRFKSILVAAALELPKAINQLFLSELLRGAQLWLMAFACSDALCAHEREIFFSRDFDVYPNRIELLIFNA